MEIRKWAENSEKVSRPKPGLPASHSDAFSHDFPNQGRCHYFIFFTSQWYRNKQVIFSSKDTRGKSPVGARDGGKKKTEKDEKNQSSTTWILLPNNLLC